MAERLMKDSGIEWIGKIPQNWKTAKLKRITSISTGSTPSKSDASLYFSNKEGLPWIKAEDLGTGRPITGTSEYITQAGRELCKVFPKNSVYVCCIASVGKTGFCNVEASCNQQINVMPFEKAYWKYGYYLTVAQETEYLINASGNVMKILNAEKQSNLMCTVPSCEEQVRIADFLDKKASEIDAVISKTKESIEEYKKLKQSIITEAVTKGLDPNVEMKDSGVDWIGDIPAKWEKSYFRYAARIKDGLVDPREPIYSEYPHIGPGNIEKYTGKLLDYKLVKDEGLISGKYIFDENDLVYGKINPQLGKVAFPHFSGLCSADAYAITSNTELVKTEYLFYFMLSKNFIDRTVLESLRTGMPKINRNDLNKLEIILPEINEQVQIVGYLNKRCSKYDSLISKKEQVITELEQYKKSLIYEYVTGKKEVVNG